MHAALDGADVVGEGHDALGVGGVPLDGDLDLAGLLHRGTLLGGSGQVDGVLEALGHGLALVQELDEVDDAAGVAELLDLGLDVYKRQVLAEVLEVTTAQGMALYVHTGPKQHIHALLDRLLAQRGAHFLDKRRVKRARERGGGGETG